MLRRRLRSRREFRYATDANPSDFLTECGEITANFSGVILYRDWFLVSLRLVT
jgi:hypothetical protein